MNVAQIQNSRRKEAWDKIESLVGTEVKCASAADGQVTWKVVPNATEDLFTERVEKEKEWLRVNSPMKDEIKSIVELFAVLWPSDIETDCESFKNIVIEENKLRKDAGKRSIPTVSLFVVYFCIVFLNMHCTNISFLISFLVSADGSRIHDTPRSNDCSTNICEIRKQAMEDQRRQYQ